MDGFALAVKRNPQHSRCGYRALPAHAWSKGVPSDRTDGP